MVGFGGMDHAQPEPQPLDCSAITTEEALRAALEQGRLEPFYLVDPAFGGPLEAMNVLYGPVGVTARKRAIDAEIMRALDAGQQVPIRASVDYGGGDSRVPRRVSYDLGPVGTRVLEVW